MWLFVFDTVLIAAAGYVVNDIYDGATDSVNKPTKTYIGAGSLTAKSAWIYYFILCILGAAIAAYIAIEIGKPQLFMIFPLATFLLYMYSKRWKRRPLSGNIVVAIFCAFVPSIIWYAEAQSMAQLSNLQPALTLLFAAYIAFGFLATLVRELIKDLEDEAGDRAAGYCTFVIDRGAKMTRTLASWILALLISSYGLWLLAIWRLGDWIAITLVVLMMLTPSLIILVRINNSREKKQYSLISKHLKILMLASLIVFIVTLIHL